MSSSLLKKIIKEVLLINLIIMRTPTISSYNEKQITLSYF